MALDILQLVVDHIALGIDILIDRVVVSLVHLVHTRTIMIVDALIAPELAPIYILFLHVAGVLVLAAFIQAVGALAMRRVSAVSTGRHVMTTARAFKFGSLDKKIEGRLPLCKFRAGEPCESVQPVRIMIRIYRVILFLEQDRQEIILGLVFIVEPPCLSVGNSIRAMIQVIKALLKGFRIIRREGVSYLAIGQPLRQWKGWIE
jgi:hypothetical protein